MVSREEKARRKAMKDSIKVMQSQQKGSFEKLVVAEKKLQQEQNQKKMDAQENIPPTQEQKSQFKVKPTDPIAYFALAGIMLIFDFFILRNFQGFTVQFPEAFKSIQFISSIILGGIAAVGFSFRKHREYFLPVLVFAFTFFYLISTGMPLTVLLHFCFIIGIAALVLNDTGNKETELIILSVFMLFDFFGYVFIGHLDRIYSAPSWIIATFSNRFIVPIWMYYALSRNFFVKKSLWSFILIIFLFVGNMVYFNANYNIMQDTIAEISEAPEQIKEAIPYWKNIWNGFVTFFTQSLIIPFKCSGSFADPGGYDECVKEQNMIRECELEKEEGETVSQCIERKKKEQKTDGDTLRIEYVKAEIKKATEQKKFENFGADIIYWLDINEKHPIEVEKINCIFKNKEKENNKVFEVPSRPAIENQEINEDTYLTCYLPETEEPGDYTNTITINIQDVETWAILTLHFIGDKSIYDQKTSTADDYNTKLANQRIAWKTEYDRSTFNGKVQSKASPSSVWAKIGPPVVEGRTTFLPVNYFPVNKELTLVMGLTNKGGGKASIEEIEVELPDYMRIITEGVCSVFQPKTIVENSKTKLVFSISKNNEKGRLFLNNLAKKLEKEQGREYEVNLITCNIESTNYDDFIEVSTTPTNPKEFKIKLIYDYQTKNSFDFTYSKTEAIS